MRTIAGMLFALVVVSAAAQPSPEEAVRRAVAPYPPVQFAGAVLDSVPVLGSLSNVTIKPPGEGPFPAVVLVHTCGGIKDAHIADHARELLAEGFVVAVQDSFGPRGKRDCGMNNAQALVSLVGVNDAYAALGYLRATGIVDPERIFLVGYSWGSMTAQLVASGALARTLGAAGRFRASVANYPGCLSAAGRPFLNPETVDRPVLLLLGDKDTETPPEPCLRSAAAAQAAGRPVQVHVYPDTTHGWDKIGQVRDGYVYDAGVAKDATQRMVRFFKDASGVTKP